MNAGGYVIFTVSKNYQIFYSSFFGIPLAGALLPVVSFFLLDIYEKVVWLLGATIILRVGHILKQFQNYKVNYLLIDDEYQVDIEI